MSKTKNPPTPGGVPILRRLLLCLMASCGALFFVTHYKDRAQSTQANATNIDGVHGLNVSPNIPESDGYYLSFVMAEEKRLQNRYQEHRRKYEVPAPREGAHLEYLADHEARLRKDLEAIGGQNGLASNIQEQLENARSSEH